MPHLLDYANLHRPALCTVLFGVIYKIIDAEWMVRAPDAVRHDGGGKLWRWKNILMSLVHSATTMMACTFVFIQTPELITNPCMECSTATVWWAAFSTGFMVYDCYNLLAHGGPGHAIEVLHHIMSMSLMFLILLINSACGIIILCQVTEFSTTLLHTRKLMKFAEKQDTPLFRLVRALSLPVSLTRFAPSLLLCYHLYIHTGWGFSWLIHPGITGMCLGGLMLYNVYIVASIFRVDYGGKSHEKEH